MLLLERGELRLLRRDFLGQHALQGGQRPLATGKAAEGALGEERERSRVWAFWGVMSRYLRVST